MNTEVLGKALLSKNYIFSAFLLVILVFSGCSQPHTTTTAQVPSPSVIRGDGALSVAWVAEAGVVYEVWYRTENNDETGTRWEGTITRSGIVAGASITGLTNGAAYYVWLRSQDGRLSAESSGTPRALPSSVPDGFVYVSGGTVIGSARYTMSMTIPVGSIYHNAGNTRTMPGVFVEGRTVEIESFFMAKHQVTRGLWYEVQSWAQSNNYFFQNTIAAPNNIDKNIPVTGINWRDAIIWSNAYSEMSGLDPVYRSDGNVLRDSRNANAAAVDNATMDRTRNGFRLPTEVEREFAARGGEPGKADWMFHFAGSNNAEEVVWHHGNSPRQPQDAGTKSANRLGVFDLSGNVQEWGWGWMFWNRPVTPQTPVDGYPRGAPFTQKPMAGGGVGSNITMSVVADRWGAPVTLVDPVVGFRIVRGAR